jgi:RimJ/RimL family protein N-acetyltransferase
MIKGVRVLLRPVGDGDWQTIEEWGRSREALWGEFQRFQMDHLPKLRGALQQTGMLTRESGLLLVESLDNQQVVGFVRYTLLPFPDADFAYPEIGFGIPAISARGQGYALEAVHLLVDYPLAGYSTERVAAFTDAENLPAQGLLEKLGFSREGTLRRASFRDGRWRDMVIYAILRKEWEPERARA